MSVNRGLTLAAARLQILMSIAFSAAARFFACHSYPSISFGPNDWLVLFCATKHASCSEQR